MRKEATRDAENQPFVLNIRGRHMGPGGVGEGVGVSVAVAVAVFVGVDVVVGVNVGVLVGGSSKYAMERSGRNPNSLYSREYRP
jgi:hypothetical protein